MMIQIVPLDESHYEDIAKLYFYDFFLPDNPQDVFENNRNSLLNLCANMNPKFSFVALDGNTFVGHILCHLLVEAADIKGSLYVKSIEVMPKYRRMHVGTNLMRHVFQFANSEEIKSICLDVKKSNTSIKDWYKRLGFHVTEYETLEAGI